MKYLHSREWFYLAIVWLESYPQSHLHHYPLQIWLECKLPSQSPMALALALALASRCQLIYYSDHHLLPWWCSSLCPDPIQYNLQKASSGVKLVLLLLSKLILWSCPECSEPTGISNTAEWRYLEYCWQYLAISQIQSNCRWNSSILRILVLLHLHWVWTRM